jgi:hypothetical protein
VKPCSHEHVYYGFASATFQNQLTVADGCRRLVADGDELVLKNFLCFSSVHYFLESLGKHSPMVEVHQLTRKQAAVCVAIRHQGIQNPPFQVGVRVTGG